MRKTDIADLEQRIIPLVNKCPRCGGNLKAVILIGIGVCRPMVQRCVQACGFENNIAKEKHG